MSEQPDAWKSELCTCAGEAQHIHCPWGGAHVHYVDDNGNDIEAPAGSKLRAVNAVLCQAGPALRMNITDPKFKLGFVDLENWHGFGHRICEAPRHAGLEIPATAVIALAKLLPDYSLNDDESVVWGACIECFGLIDRDMNGDWRLPGTYSHDDY